MGDRYLVSHGIVGCDEADDARIFNQFVETTTAEERETCQRIGKCGLEWEVLDSELVRFRCDWSDCPNRTLPVEMAKKLAEKLDELAVIERERHTESQ